MEKLVISTILNKSWQDCKTHYLQAIESNWYKILLELQNQICFDTYRFYEDKGIKTIFFPVTTGSISSPMGLGSDSSPVKISLFGIDTYLADSMQFMLEYGCRFFDKGCFYIMPSFRGEKADSRHLCQFFHSEVEIPGNLSDIINLAEQYVKFLVGNLILKHSQNIKSIAGNLDHLTYMLSLTRFPQITYKEAIKLLKGFDGGIKTVKDLQVISSKGEQKLMEEFGGIVWLTDMDKRTVPFYQAPIQQDLNYAACADLLIGIGEVIGLGERHSSGEEVETALSLHHVSKNEYEWYINLKNKYPMKTSGFGMGIERFLLWVLKHNEIRDCQLMPRFNGEEILF